MHRFSFSGARAGLPLVLAAGLALTASACMSPAAKQSSAAGTADRQAAKAKSGEKSGEKAGENLTWWQRLKRYNREPEEKPWAYGDVRPGKGLLSDDEDGFVLMRQGEAGRSADPAKPAKVRR